MLSRDTTPVQFFNAVWSGIADDMAIEIKFPIDDTTLKFLDEMKITQWYQVHKASAEVEGRVQHAVIVDTHLGHVVMYDTVGADGELHITAVCDNELIPFVRLDPKMTISDIALVARPGNSQNNNIAIDLGALLHKARKKEQEAAQ